jgi:hypothetical protein
MRTLDTRIYEPGDYGSPEARAMEIATLRAEAARELGEIDRERQAARAFRRDAAAARKAEARRAAARRRLGDN